MTRDARYWRFLASTMGVPAVARHLAVQGVPLDAALALLGIRPTRAVP